MHRDTAKEAEEIVERLLATVKRVKSVAPERRDNPVEKGRCESSSRNNEIAVGVVTTDEDLFNFSVPSSQTSNLPLNTPIFLTDNVRVDVTGGIIIPHDGLYLIQFSIVTSSPTGNEHLSVFAGPRFIGNVDIETVGGGGIKLVTFVVTQWLKRGDVVRVVASNIETTHPFNSRPTLTIAKLD